MKNLSAKLACAMLAITLGAASLTGCGQGKVIDGTAEAIVVNDESVNLGVANFFDSVSAGHDGQLLYNVRAGYQ